MKANQTIRQDEEAVSPVIGVILMVAITVVLAAVVFVLVTKLSGNSTNSSPTAQFIKSSSAGGGGTLTVQSTTSPIPWTSLYVGVNGGAPAAITSGTAGLTECKVPTGTTLANNMQAGEVITCGASVTSVTFTYKANTASSGNLVYQTNFP